MGRELSHTEAAGLLGAYALDAVERDECADLEEHLRDCLICQSELAQHREVAGFLAPVDTRAPDQLWDRIASSIEQAPPALDLAAFREAAAKHRRPRERRSGRAAAGRGAGRAAGAAPPGRVPGSMDRHSGSRPGRSGLVAAAAAAAAVLVGLAGVAGFEIAGGSGGSPSQSAAVAAAAKAAFANPAGRRVDMRSSSGDVSAEAVVLPDGTGYIVKDNLPVLDSRRTYQLWAVNGESKVSVGVLGPDPGAVGFRAAGDVSALAITRERSGGVEVTVQDPVVVGALKPA